MRQISIEIIHRCPNKCIHCSSYSDKGCTQKIETEKVKGLIDDAKELRTEIISISGGEPFLHEGLVEIARYAKEKGIASYVYTGGIQYNERGEGESIPREKLQELKEIPIEKIIFDLPAIEESVYNHFMGTEGYQKLAFETIEKAQELGIHTEVHYVPTKANIGEIDKIIEYAQKAGIEKVSFLGLVPHGRAKENKSELMLSAEETAQLKKKLKGLEGERIRIGIPLQIENEEYRCHAGRSKLCIRYDGKVFGCEAFKYIELSDENQKVVEPDSIYERSLEDIYKHSKYLKLEQKFIEEQLKEENCREKCPVQRKIRKAV